MPKYRDFPLVIIDVVSFHRWPKNKQPKEVTWIIPPADPKQLSKPASSIGSPAHHEDITGDSNHDSGRSSPASSQAASPGCSAGSVAEELVSDSSKSDSDSGSDTPAMSRDPSDDERDQASSGNSAGPSGDGRRSDNEGDRGEGGECRGGVRGSESSHESDDSSSDSEDDNTSDDGGGASEVAQHLEEVYSQILKALHKTAKIMCTGYEKASGDVQPIVQAAVQEAVRPNNTYIQAATSHLSEWGQALHDMLNSDGASAKERERTNRAARLAGLKCVRSLLADGQAINEAEEQDTEQRLCDTIQATLKVANKWADKTFVKVNKRIPGIIRRYVPDDQVGTFITSVYRSMGDHYLSVHGMVMSQVVVPFHVALGTYHTSGNMFRVINNMVPGLSAAAANYWAALPALPATTDWGISSQVHISEEMREVPLQDMLADRPGKQGRSETGTPGKAGEQASSKRSLGKAPLMSQSRRDFKALEDKIQTGETPGSKRGSSSKKVDSDEIAKTWEGFEREDVAHDAARRVLQMNPMSGVKALSLTDHEDLSIEVLTERDAPSRGETSGQVSRKRKEDTSQMKMKNVRWSLPITRRGRNRP